MSTKIYEAYRVPVRRLAELLDIVRKAVVKRAAHQVGVVMGVVDGAKLKERVDDYRKSWETAGKTMPAWTERSVWTEMALDLCEAASAKMERDLDAALDCGLNIWIRGAFAYVIPWGEGYLFEKVRWPKWAVDYRYQNSTDRPDDISARAWRERKKMWGQLCLGDGARWNDRRLCFEIINLKPHESVSSRLLLLGIRVPERYAEDRKFSMRGRKR